MQKLKSLLQSRYLWMFLICLWILLFFYRIQKLEESVYQSTDTVFWGRVQEVRLEDGRLQLTLLTEPSHEVLKGTLENGENISLQIHDFVQVKGTLQELSSRTTFYLFDYREYAKRHRQYYSVKIEAIQLIEKNKNWLFAMKNWFIERIDGFESSGYLSAFVLGDTSQIQKEVMESYQNNGISHLLAVSGMHVSFLTGVVLWLLKKMHCGDHSQIILITCFLGIYCFLVDFSPSVLRTSLFFLLLQLKRLWNWKISPFWLLIIVCMLLLTVNPFYLWEVGFQFSFFISGVLVISKDRLQRCKNYWGQLFMISYLAFLASLPISVWNFHQINIASSFYNLLFVPLVSFCIFPFSFLVFLFPIVEPIYLIFIHVLEGISCFLNQFDMVQLVMRHPNGIGVFYLLGIFIFTWILFMKGKKYHYFVIILGIFFYHSIPFFLNEEYMTFLDVGQGDATFLYSKNESMLVDTGGALYKDIATATIIPYLKAMGISKIQTLVLTHGDYDHVGAAISLIQNFRVEKVFFNNNSYNQNELYIISLLEKKQIPYFKISENITYQVGNFSIHAYSFFNMDENDASTVLYGNNLDFSFMLMGDASKNTEKKLLDAYRFLDVDILKVGHHGSKTGTSDRLLETVCPKVAFISAGRKNRFGHPHREVVERLQNYSVSVYSTQDKGSILVDFRKNGNIFTTIP